MVKNLLASVGDPRDAGLTPGSERSLGVGVGSRQFPTGVGSRQLPAGAGSRQLRK